MAHIFDVDPTITHLPLPDHEPAFARFFQYGRRPGPTEIEIIAPARMLNPKSEIEPPPSSQIELNFE